MAPRILTPLVLLAGVLLERYGASALWLCAACLGLYILAAHAEGRRAELAARQKQKDEEHAHFTAREVALLAQTLRLTPREQVLLLELDARTWLGTAAGVVYSNFHREFSRALKENLQTNVLDWLTPLGPINKLTFQEFDLGAKAPRIDRVVPVRLAEPTELMVDIDLHHVGTDIDVRIAARLGGKHVGATVSLGLSSVSFEATLRVKVALCKRSQSAQNLFCV